MERIFQIRLLIAIINIVSMNLREFTYTAELQKAAQGSKWNDTLSEVLTESPQIMNKDHIAANAFQLKHSHTSLLQFEQSLYYFFLSDSSNAEKKRKEFTLTVVSFKKKDGENHSVSIKGFKGTPSVIATGFLTLNEPAKATSKGECKVEGASSRYRIVALIGLEQGFLKIIEFTEREGSLKLITNSHKIEQKSVVSIIPADKRFYGKKNICFILMEDSKVFIYNYLSKQVIAIFQPPVLSHDFAICISIHFSGNYLATASKSGQIFYWQLGKSVFEAIEKSENRIKKKSRNELSNNTDEQEEFVWQFTAKDRVINVFPMHSLHSASIHGLKWIAFYGNLMAMVSRTGLFRLIAVNFQMRDQFLSLVEYQIQEGQAVSSMQIFPELEVLVVTKRKEYVALLSEEESRARVNDEATLKWKEEAIKRNDYHSRMNANCYGPKKIKECLIQKIKFGGDLRIEKVERVRMMEKLNSRLLNFTYSIVSGQCKFILVGNSKEYGIAPCDEFFGVER